MENDNPQFRSRLLSFHKKKKPEVSVPAFLVDGDGIDAIEV